MSKPRLNPTFILLGLLTLRCLPAFSATITVTKGAGAGKEAISLVEIQVSGNSGQIFQQTLQNDLVRSGYFTTDGGRYSNFKVTGTAIGTGEQLQTSLVISSPGGSFTWRESSRGVSAARWQAHRLNDTIIRRLLGKEGMASTRIAMIGKHDGSDIYICDYDGANLMRLTQDRVTSLSPYWHPSGDHLFYTSFLRGFPCIYRVPSVGGQRTPLAQFAGLNTGGAVSPDRKLIALILSLPGNPELYALNLHTKKLTRLTHTPRAAEASPCWSPDGKSIAYVSDASGSPQIYIMRDNSREPRRLTMTGRENVAPSWGPDGRITHTTRRDGYQVAVTNPNTGETTVLTSGPDHEDPSWAPDGRHIICSRREGPNRTSLLILDTQGDQPLRLMAREGNWVSPEWSPQLLK